VIGHAEVEDRDGVVVARVIGEIDLSNVENVEKKILSAIQPDARGLVLDLTPTTYLDSTGIRMIFELARRLQDRRHDLRVVVTEDTLVHRVLAVTQVHDAIPIDTSVAAAVAALESKSLD
jgi:anti-sigma B factor antagonist/stage II sporulation protein AA (anti-sigma F factor antagonist)